MKSPTRAPLSEVLRQRPCDVTVSPEATYEFAGVKSFGGGVFRSLTKEGSAFSYRVLTRIHQDEFVYPKLMAWEGALGVVPEECDGLVVSPEFCVFEIDRAKVIPQWLGFYFRQPWVWPALAGGSAGTNVRRRRIYPDDFLRFEVELPSMDVQRAKVDWLQAIEQGLKRVRDLRAEADSIIENIWVRVAERLVDSHVSRGPSAKLGDVVDVQGGGTPSKSNPTYWSGPIPWVSPKDMKTWNIVDAEDHISVAATTETSAKLVRSGAVLVVTRGMILARTVPVGLLTVDAAINQDMKALRSDRLSGEYLAIVLRALRRRLLGRVEKSTHDTRKLETAKLLEVEVPLLDPTAQQHVVNELVSLRERITKAEARAADVRADVNALWSAALAQAFERARIENVSAGYCS